MQMERTFKAASGITGGIILGFIALASAGLVGGNAWVLATKSAPIEKTLLGVLVLCVFAIIPLALFRFAWCGVRDHLRFGRLWAGITRFPSVESAVLEGRVEVPRGVSMLRWRVSFRCEHFRRTGSGKSARTVRETVWEETAPVTMTQSLAGVSLAFQQEIPAHLPPTQRERRSGYSWEIIVRGEDIAGKEVFQTSIDIPIEREAVARQASFAASEVKANREISDGRGQVSSQLMTLGSEVASFDALLFETPQEKKLGRVFLSMLAVFPVVAIALARREDLTGFYYGLAASPLPVILLVAASRLRFLLKLSGVLFLGAAALTAVWSGHGEAIFVAAALGFFGPFALVAWFGSPAFRIALSPGGIAKRHLKRFGKHDEVLAWQDIKGFKVHDKRANAQRERESKATRRFTVLAEMTGRTVVVSPSFEDADDAVRVVDWLEAAGRRYGFRKAGA